MSVEIRFISYEKQNLVHIGEGHSKEECLRLIGDKEPSQDGIYEYRVHTHKLTTYVSNVDKVDVKKVLDKIFE